MRYFNGHEFEFKRINPSLIVIDIYQRKTDDKRVDEIIKDFDGDVFNEPKVSFRDGKFYCFNGQHTVAVWRKMFGDEPILCKVYKGMTWVDECEEFIKQNGHARLPKMTDILRAARIEEREDVMLMISGAEMFGFEVGFDKTKKNNKIVAVAALHKASYKLGKEKYIEMLGVIKNAWNGDSDSLSVGIIGAMRQLFMRHYGEFDSGELAKNLSKVRPVDLLRNGRGRRDGVMFEIIKVYNKGRRMNKIKVD